MIEKIKVTKQEIRTYETNGKVQSWTYSEEWLKTILGGKEKYTISSKNSNVTWYTVQDAEPIETPEIISDSPISLGEHNIAILEADGYSISKSAKESIIEHEIDIEELKAAAKDKKITGHTINSIL